MSRNLVDVLLAARAVPGLGGALMSPAALSIITVIFEEGRSATAALGIYAAITAGGAAARPRSSAASSPSTRSWRWVFFVNLPIAAVAALLALRFVPNSRSTERPETYDTAGAVTVTGGLLVLVFAIVKAQTYGWGSAKTIGLFVAAVALLAAFVVVERRSKAPLDPARHLPHALAVRLERRDAARRLRPLRDVLLRLALHAGDPRLQAAEGRFRPSCRSRSWIIVGAGAVAGR